MHVLGYVGREGNAILSCYEDAEDKQLAEYFSPFVFLLVWIYNEFPASPTTDPGTPEQVNSSEWNS